MTDRELLEMAAKAAQLEGEPLWAGEAGISLWKPSTGTRFWNPLTDDGDALRLAVKLHINVEHLRTLKVMQFNEVAAAPFGRGDCMATEGTGSDPYAATRRAIVRAAAELGKGQP